jgi:murein DD-endopeptidase MepM/ murein hydrolase activator NlpD
MGSGGWYWPAGTEDFQGWDGYWNYRPGSHPRWHVAQDMPTSVGHPVYAIGDGVILESGDGHGYGGVLVVLHKTDDGQYFKAVYGHIRRSSKTKKGAKVKAGQIIGRVNGAAHVHFGIHPGRAYPPDRNPYRGHTYTSKKTYGWVDPVAFLRENPRVLK